MPYGDPGNSNLFDNDGLLWGRDQDVQHTQITKAQALYRVSTESDKSCGKCRYFLEGGACKVVQGYVEDNFVCDLFKNKVAKPDLSNIVSKFLRDY